MQPTFFPWLGYLNLIQNSDIFCFYDDAQYSKFSWHSRVRVNMNKLEILISVPTSVNLGMNINQAQVVNCEFFLKKFIKTIDINCKNKQNKDFLFSLIENIKKDKILNLAEFNIKIIKELLIYLDIKSKLINRSSLNLSLNDSKDKKVFATLQKLSCTNYLCGESGFKYLDPFDFKSFNIIPSQLMIRDSSFNLGSLHYLFNYEPDEIKYIIDNNFYFTNPYI